MATAYHMSVNVMAPLVVGDPAALNSEVSHKAWEEFDAHLAAIKALGVDAVSTDVWWGLIEKTEGVFDWAYYDQLSDHIINHGLKWVPILSFHQCGGNIGDSCNVPLPGWVWTKLAAQTPSGKVEAVKFVSEHWNHPDEDVRKASVSDDSVSVWATDLALPLYRKVMVAFQAHYASKKASISEINVSLGPAGELRYPSYREKGHDYPNRGALQCYSDLAVESFRDAMFAKYPEADGLKKAWGYQFARSEVKPPNDVNYFFEKNQHKDLQYGRDLFDWYQDCLIAHGRKIMTVAIEIFAADGAAFAGIEIGSKVPGIHWRLGRYEGKKLVLGDRLAELPAGLIRTSGEDWMSDDHGYRYIIGLFKELGEAHPEAKLVLHFTCLEMADGSGGAKLDCLPASLVRWVGAEAKRQGLVIKGENALGWNIPVRNAWRRLRSALVSPVGKGVYVGITLLRMSDILASDTAKDQLRKLIKRRNSARDSEAAA